MTDTFSERVVNRYRAEIVASRRRAIIKAVPARELREWLFALSPRDRNFYKLSSREMQVEVVNRWPEFEEVIFGWLDVAKQDA
jgi:hypothetical protein